MKTRSHLLIFLLLFFEGFNLIAQHDHGHNREQDKEKIEALRISYITTKLELSASESEKFWPVYNEFNDKLRGLRRNLKQSYHNKADNLSEKEAEELYYLELQTRQAETDLFKQYSEKIKAIIGVKKTIRLHRAEAEFKREVINRIKEKVD